MQLRTRTDLLALAGKYANERKVPANTIVKEILHYEILYALTQSGAAAQLTFQGGTALRLCYQGTRYSEDLDFAAGDAFKPDAMVPFADLLRREIGDAYGLQVDIKAPRPRSRLGVFMSPAGVPRSRCPRSTRAFRRTRSSTLRWPAFRHTMLTWCPSRPTTLICRHLTAS